MQILQNPAKCACCGEPMAQGEAFRWVEKQVAQGSKVGSYKTAYRPAHLDLYCGARKFEAERIEGEIASLQRTIEALSAMPGCEPAIELLEGRITEERAKLSAIANW